MGQTEPVDGEVARQFGALTIDHEGRFGVRVTLAGGLGAAEVETNVDATYDERPPAIILVLYLIPFLFVGFMGLRLLLSRRKSRVRPD